LLIRINANKNPIINPINIEKIVSSIVNIAEYKISEKLSKSGFIYDWKLYFFSNLLKYFKLIVVKIKYKNAAKQ